MTVSSGRRTARQATSPRTAVVRRARLSSRERSGFSGRRPAPSTGPAGLVRILVRSSVDDAGVLAWKIRALGKIRRSGVHRIFPKAAFFPNFPVWDVPLIARVSPYTGVTVEGGLAAQGCWQRGGRGGRRASGRSGPGRWLRPGPGRSGTRRRAAGAGAGPLCHQSLRPGDTAGFQTPAQRNPSVFCYLITGQCWIVLSSPM